MRNLSVRLVYGRRSVGIAPNSQIDEIPCVYSSYEIPYINPIYALQCRVNQSIHVPVNYFFVIDREHPFLVKFNDSKAVIVVIVGHIVRR